MRTAVNGIWHPTPKGTELRAAHKPRGTISAVTGQRCLTESGQLTQPIPSNKRIASRIVQYRNTAYL